MTYIVSIIALCGIFLNAKQKWYGFLFWLFSNAWWCRYNFVIGEYAQSALFGVFWLLSVYGIFQWRKKTTAEATDANQLNETKSKITGFCTRILSIKENLDRKPGRIKINWLLSEARGILELLSDKKSDKKT